MKPFYISFVGALLGVALGAGLAINEIGDYSASSSDAAAESNEPPMPGPDEKLPVAKFDAETYDFGVMERETTASHAFTVTNEGTGPLLLSVGETTCKCTVGEVSDAPISPGESAPIRLEWTARTAAPEFRQSATILTNDPKRRRIELTVSGNVTEPTTVSPHELNFGKVALGESKTLEVFVLSHTADDFQILGHEFVGLASPEQFDVTIRPAAQAELPDPTAKHGYRVVVTLRESATHGGVRGWLRISTNLEKAERIDVPIDARVVSDVSIFGKNYNVATGVLRLGAIRSAEGTSTKLILTIKGESAKNAEVRVAEVFPEFVVANVGEPAIGKVVQIPLEIGVTPGAPASAFVGGKEGEYGRVVLETNNSRVPRIEIELWFTVEE